MATRVPNPISFHYTSNESLLNKLSGSIKHVLVYTRTHLTRSDEYLVFRCGGIKVVSRSQTAIFSFILGREKIGSGTPPIEKAVLASTAIGVGDYWQWLLCNR